MGARKWAALMSVLIFLLSYWGLCVNGLKMGLILTGVHKLKYPIKNAADLSTIRDNLYRIGFKEAKVVSYGTSKDVLISIAPRVDIDQMILVDKVMQALPGSTKQRVDFCGPQWPKSL